MTSRWPVGFEEAGEGNLPAVPVRPDVNVRRRSVPSVDEAVEAFVDVVVRRAQRL